MPSGLLRHSGAALAALAAVPAIAAWLVLRPAWRHAFAERIGCDGAGGEVDIWLHTASVGEARAALPLVDALAARGHRCMVSTTTPAGRTTWGQLRPELPLRFAPLDHPWPTGRVLDRLRPRVLTLVESELWPAWIAAAARRGIPVAVVSARMSPRSFTRYRRLGPLTARTFARLGGVGARSGEDAQRFVTLGVAPERLRVTGDLKFAPPSAAPDPSSAPDTAAALAPELVAFLGSTRPLVAVSTRPGEEELLLEALRRLLAHRPGARLVLAPRHLDRIASVERLVRRRGFQLKRRSALSVGSPPRFAAGSVLLFDTVGEIAALLPWAGVVFVGGTLVPVGGHNVLEPVWAGRPVLFGRHLERVAHAAALLLEAGAARRVADAAELAAAAEAWLADPTAAAEAVARARRALGAHSGAAERNADLVEALLSGEGAPEGARTRPC